MQKQSYQAIGILPEELRVGDIILETDYRDNPGTIHKTIRVGQYFQSVFFPNGHRQSVHAAMIAEASDVIGKPLKFVEVIGKGIQCKDLSELKKCTYFVLRPQREDFAAEIGRIAYFMYKHLHKEPPKSVPEQVNPDALVVSAPTGFRHQATGNPQKAVSAATVVTPVAIRQDGDIEISRPAGFVHRASATSQEDAVAALKQAALEEMRVSSPNGFAKQGSGRSLQYSRMYAALSVLIPYELLFPNVFKTQYQVSLDNFCSMFVIECMQLAQANLGLGEYIHLEKRSSPRSLEDYLKRHPDFKCHVIAKDHQNVTHLVLETILRDEIEKRKASDDPLQRRAGATAEGQLEYLQKQLGITDCSVRLPHNVSDFDLVAVILNRTLPLLGWPESVIAETRLFGLGHLTLKSADVAQMANKLLDLEPSDNNVLGM